MEQHTTAGCGTSISYRWDKHDPAIRKTYLKKIQVACCNCNAIHEYQIRVQGITGVRVFASRAIDCDHHCKTCGVSIEPINYVPDPEEERVKRLESEARKLKKMLVKERVFVMNAPCKPHPKRHYRDANWYLEHGWQRRNTV